MKRHLNLMSSSAQVRSIVRIRVFQWSLTGACLIILLAPLLFAAWWPVHQESRSVASLEAQFEPIRELKIASRSFKEKLEQINAKEHATLTLAKINTPVVTLLGVVGKAVTDNPEGIVLEEIRFDQETRLSEAAAGAKPTLGIEGYGLDNSAIEQLTDSLQAALPFGKVTLKLIGSEELYQQQIHRFSIRCSL